MKNICLSCGESFISHKKEDVCFLCNPYMEDIMEENTQ